MQAVEYPTIEETSPSLAAVVAAVDIARFPFRGRTSPDDGFMLIFASASAALASAVELQEVFSVYNARHADQPLRVRIGLHTGNVFQERDDFLGKTVIVAARLAGRARGGEVLVSGVLKDYTEHVADWRFGPPSDLSLKGLTSPQRVHSVYWNTESQ